MCDTANDRDPRAALAETIRRKTDNGNDVVDYLLDVLHERLDGVKHLHRERAASILTEYGDLAAIRFMEKNRENRKTCKPANRQPRSEAEDSRFDAALAQVIRDKTNEAEDIADYLIDTMNGIDSAVGSGLGRIAHRHRVAAAIELLRRGFDYDRARSTAVPAYAGTRQDDRPGASRDHARAEPEPEIADEPVDYVAMAKEIVANLDPSELEEEPPSPHKPNYTMWEIIRKQPKPAITEEQARIGAARFHERIQRQIRWRESGVKTPARKDHDNYDDG